MPHCPYFEPPPPPPLPIKEGEIRSKSNNSPKATLESRTLARLAFLSLRISAVKLFLGGMSLRSWREKM